MPAQPGPRSDQIQPGDGNPGDVMAIGPAGRAEFLDPASLGLTSSLADTLIVGNTTGGNDLAISPGDDIVGLEKLNIGTTTSATAVGDFSAGVTGSNRMSYAQSAGALSIIGGDTVTIDADSVIGSANLTIGVDATPLGELSFTARGSTTLFNEAGQESLDVSFTATSIIGALNELVAGGGGFSISFGATAASNDFFITNGDSNRTGQASSDHSVRASIPASSTMVAVGWSANGNDTISIRKNGAFVESFAVANGNGVFVTAATSFAAGDYLELRSSGGVVAQFQCYYSTTVGIGGGSIDLGTTRIASGTSRQITIPADTLAANGDRVICEIAGASGASGNFTVAVGGVTVFTGTADSFVGHLVVVRTGAMTADLWIHAGAANPVPSGPDPGVTVGAAIDWSLSQNISFTRANAAFMSMTARKIS